MATLDITQGYKEIENKVSATRAFSDLKSQYQEAQKKAGDAFEKGANTVTQGLNKITDKQKRFERQFKNQFEHLLDINNTTGGKGSNSAKYIKRLLLQTLKNIQPKLSEILYEESINVIGCSQQQVYNSGPIYIKVQSIDIGNLLKVEPTSDIGNILYEKKTTTQPQNYPYSMNRELYNLIQSSNSYSTNSVGNVLYKGQSGQDLFDIKYVNINPITLEGGDWYEINLSNRQGGVNKVAEFVVDYYKTIKLVEFTNIITSIMEALTGAISISANIGVAQAQDNAKFQKILLRILGLCFDSSGALNEIDVSGIAKLAELDDINDAFFEFTDIDLRQIDQIVTNIKNGVVQYENCDFVSLPVDAPNIINNLNQLNYIEDSGSDQDVINAAENITQSLTNNPAWSGLAIQGNINAAVDLNFIKLITQGLVGAIITPKVLLPIFVMLKALGQTLVDEVNSYMTFVRIFKSFSINLVSKIGQIFVMELFQLIRKDIAKLIQSVVQDVINEKVQKKLAIILKLIQLLFPFLQLITDFRRCKSIIDDLLNLLKSVSVSFGDSIPLPLLFGTALLDGYSQSRAFLNTVEELQKLGIPTGPMPDGSPNLDVLAKYAQIIGMEAEKTENGKVQVAIGPLAITPAGLTVPQSAYGKYF